MGVAKYDIHVYEQRKRFTGMEKKLMLNLVLSLMLRFTAALYSTVSYNKNKSIKIEKKIKKVWSETL